MTTNDAAKSRMHRKVRARNGLQMLATLGVPEGALSTLLVALAVLTVLPHFAGREFGPYSVPDLLAPGVFWTLTVLSPFLWVLLLGRTFRAEKENLKRLIAIAVAFELLSMVIAFGSSTTTHSELFSLKIDAGRERAFTVALPAVTRATQRLDVTLTEVSGDSLLPGGAQVAVGICGASDQKCGFEQIGVGTTLVRKFEKGNVRIAVFNFEANKTTVTAILKVDYLRRRFI